MNKQTHDFLDYLLNERKYSQKTVDSYKFDIEKFFDFLLKEGTLMDEVDQITIRNFLTDELNAGISKRSCKRRLSSLRHFYTYLVEHHLVKENPFLLVDSPKTDKKFPHFFLLRKILRLACEFVTNRITRNNKSMRMLTLILFCPG